MRNRLFSLVVVPALLACLFTTGCVSLVPPGALDAGRGATPLERGTSRLQVGGGGGGAFAELRGYHGFIASAVGGGGGLQLEHQLLDDLAVGIEGGAAVSYITAVDDDYEESWLALPAAMYVGAHYNPGGLRWLALRGKLGAGVEVWPHVQRTNLAPYLAGRLEVVTSLPLGAFEPYAAGHVGAKANLFVPVGAEPPKPWEGYVLSPNLGATLGAQLHVAERVSVYGAVQGDLLWHWFLLPSYSLGAQVGVALTY